MGPGVITSLVEIVEETLGKRFSFLWFPGRSADPGKGPIL